MTLEEIKEMGCPLHGIACRGCVDYEDHAKAFAWLIEQAERLRTYGDHKFKCVVRRQLREGVVITADCDCGWQEIANR